MKKITPVTTSKSTSKSPAKKVSFWTEKKVASLLSWQQKLQGKEDAYGKIATKLGTTKSAVVSKLRRMSGKTS